MTLLDVYHRAFKSYRRETSDNTNCEKDRKALFPSEIAEDKLESVKYLCNIEEDWVKAIENGLEFVEKAVAEERQFIRSNGEVVPIEKVRRISKDSVEHLAKHSEMITHVPENEGGLLVPDKLYMVEKLSDYAVYENRFLYMMLCYLRNFIEYRLEKIEKLRRTYIGEMELKREVVSKKRMLRIEAKVYENRTDNPFPIPDDSSAALVKRIGDCREIINALLNTDLMVQVAKSPMIKPPIVKTNVLKMNNNFKNALALYDYIASYKGDGYSYKEVKSEFTPLQDNVADELAEAMNLTSFLAYKTGNGIEEYLNKEYEKEEERRRAEEAQRLVERLNRLKKRAAESNKTMEEYMLLLEERNRQLEKDSEEWQRIRLEIEALNKEIDELNAEKETLNRTIEELHAVIEEKEREIEALNRKYLDEISALKRAHEEELAALKTAHENEVTAIKAEWADKMTNAVNDYENRLANLNIQLSDANAKYASTMREYEVKTEELNYKIANVDNEIRRNTEEYERQLKEYENNCAESLKSADTEHKRELKTVRDEMAFIRGELDAMRMQQGLMKPSTDYTSRERFKELEREYEAFHKFFKKQWDLTKKEIRKTILWAKEEKKKK